MQIHSYSSYRMTSKQPGGFSLIEILVVLVIIGIIVGMATLAIGDNGAVKLREEGNKLSALVKLTQEEAIFQSRELGVMFWETGYAFYELVNGEWSPLQGDDILRKRELPDNIRLQLALEGINVVMSAVAQDKPQVFILSSGEMSPFDISLILEDQPELVLSADALGKLSFKDTTEP